MEVRMKKLYVSQDDKMIFGVCGGIAETFGFKANLVRLIFAASILVGSAGFWIYLMLAILTPKKKDDGQIIDVEQETEENKIRRPWNNRLLGGVCAGIANYFSWDITLTRLVFVGMTFVGGVGAMLYLFFWFLFPSED
jgi:phage shock protein C